jgi:hypothetical protein
MSAGDDVMTQRAKYRRDGEGELNVRVPLALKKSAKMAALDDGLTLQGLVKQAIANYLLDYHARKDEEREILEEVDAAAAAAAAPAEAAA